MSAKPSMFLLLALLLPCLLAPAAVAVDAERVPLRAAEDREQDRLVAPRLSPDGRYLAYVQLRAAAEVLLVTDLRDHRALDPRPRGMRRKNAMFDQTEERVFLGEHSWCAGSRPGAPNLLLFSAARAKDEKDVYLWAPGWEEPISISQSPANDGFARFSPDCGAIVFLSGRGRESGADPYLVTLAGSGGALPPRPGPVRRLASLPSGALFPTFSADGTRVLFVSAGDDPQRELAVYATAGPLGGEPTVSALLRIPEHDIVAPSPSPDDAYLAYYVSSFAPKETRARDRGERTAIRQDIHVARLTVSGGKLAAAPGAAPLVTDVADAHENTYLHGPLWEPDGDSIVTVLRDHQRGNPVIRVNVPGGKVLETYGGVDFPKDLTFGALDGRRVLLFSGLDGQTTSVFQRAQGTP
ncbi:MAG: PD40 domain-containing protein [Candidatus Schekmanbacteria bacterium]|nr:PD40 domain-containing protein [Candidatus Schekmanbacteria bacterium]